MEDKEERKTVKLPPYVKAVYGWLYCNWQMSRFFDRVWLLKLLTLGNYGKLQASLLKEIAPKSKVLQIGMTFGDQIEKTAEKIGFAGEYDLIDVCGTQIRRCEEKYKYLFPNMHFLHQDGTKTLEDKYDVIICYNLLHELPILSKIKVVDNALNSLTDKGKVVFVDYHNPSFWHPLRYVVRMFNRLYQPFAEKMWDREIHSYATKTRGFVWKKTTFFGGFYQKTVAIKKQKLVE